MPGWGATLPVNGDHIAEIYKQPSASTAIDLYCPSTCASAASVWGSQNVMSMAR